MSAPLGLQLDCQDLVESLTDYLDEELAPATRVVVEAHLELCDGCDAYLEQLRATVAGLRALPPAELAPRVHTALLEAWRS